MRYFRKRTNYRRKRSAFGRRKVAAKRRLSKPVKRAINRLISRKIETKEYSYNMGGNSNFYEQTTVVQAIGQTFSLIPAIPVGAGTGYRVGDKITIASARYRGYLALTQPGSNGHQVRIVIYSLKDYQADITSASLPTIEMQNFFRAGTTTQAPAGYFSVEGMAPINKNRINVYYDKVHSLGTNVVPVNSTSGHAAGGNSSRPFIKFWFNATKHLKQWKYDENAVNPNLPTNHNLWVSIFCCDSSNSLGSGTTPIGLFNLWTDLKYKDA